MSRRRFEEYESDDENSIVNNVFGSSSKEKSYDIIARNCNCIATDLKKYAKIRRLKPRCRIYEDIVTYAKKSSGGLNVNVQHIYKIDRKNERAPFTEKFRMMLWHGTGPQAVPGIIQTGFRPGSGGCYGGGVYFADRLAKSAAYVRKTATNIGYLFIAEVALGKMYKAHHIHSDYQSAPPGFDSVKGNGKDIPTWRQNRSYGGAILPCGDTRTNPRFSQFDLGYSEYILYDPNRIIIRFLVECTW